MWRRGGKIEKRGIRATKLIAGLALALLTAPAHAHPGGLNKSGCHNDRRNGGYHCHGGASSSEGRLDFAGGSAKTTAFRSCAEARAAGAAPIRRGAPGYGRHLDRDGDGIACE